MALKEATTDQLDSHFSYYFGDWALTSVDPNPDIAIPDESRRGRSAVQNSDLGKCHGFYHIQRVVDLMICEDGSGGPGLFEMDYDQGAEESSSMNMTDGLERRFDPTG